MEIPRHLLERLKQNEKIAQKFNEIEISILSILNFQDFFERLLFEIADKFNIPYIWISIIEDSSIARQLQGRSESETLQSCMAFVKQDRFLSIIKEQTPVLADDNLHLFKDLMPVTLTAPLGSLAIAPITLDGKLVGSINQADINPKRFEPGIDTSLLEQLAQKVSLCLSNVTAHEQLKFLAFHDPLTGLFNRGVFQRIIDREFLRAKRYHDELSLIFMDLDDFKAINDTVGHSGGDQALCYLAQTLILLKREPDVVSRFAGDEFVMILPSTQTSQAEQFIKRIHDYLEAHPMTIHGKEITIRISHGTAGIADAGVSDPDSLVKLADTRMYQQKAQKKNR